MDFSGMLEDFNEQLRQFNDWAQSYFSDLDKEEKYGWIGEGTGAVMLLVGLVLLIL